MDPTGRKHISPWGLARTAADLAFSYLALGKREAAEDALESRLLDDRSLQCYVDCARFQTLANDVPAARSWIASAVAHLAIPRRGATTLSDMAEAWNDHSDLAKALAHPAFGASRLELENLLLRPANAKDLAEIRTARRTRIKIDDLRRAAHAKGASGDSGANGESTQVAAILQKALALSKRQPGVSAAFSFAMAVVLVALGRSNEATR